MPVHRTGSASSSGEHHFGIGRYKRTSREFDLVGRGPIARNGIRAGPVAFSVILRATILPKIRGALNFIPWQNLFDSPIWNEPDQRSGHENPLGDPRRKQGGNNRSYIQQRRELALPVPANRLFQNRFRSLRA